MFLFLLLFYFVEHYQREITEILTDMEITITDQIIVDQITPVTDLITIQVQIEMQCQSHHGCMNKCME